MSNNIRLLLATASDPLDGAISAIEGVSVVKQVQYADGIMLALSRNEVDVVILSDLIQINQFTDEGKVLRESKLLDIIEEIRLKNVRVIALVGEREVGEPFLVELINRTVFDIYLGEVIDMEVLRSYIMKPRTYADVAYLKGKTAAPVVDPDEWKDEQKHNVELKQADKEEEKGFLSKFKRKKAKDSDEEGKIEVESKPSILDKAKGTLELTILAGRSSIEKGKEAIGSITESIQSKREQKQLEEVEETSAGTNKIVLTSKVSHSQQENVSLPNSTSIKARVMVIYSPVPVGKTFVGINTAIALASLGQKVYYMDATPKERTKLWFNAPSYPFGLADIPLTVGPVAKVPFQEDGLVVMECSRMKDIPRNATVVLVADSNLAYTKHIVKEIGDRWPMFRGVVWNMYDPNVSINHLIPAPIVAKLPRYTNVEEQIQKGVPHAFFDTELCKTLQMQFSIILHESSQQSEMLENF